MQVTFLGTSSGVPTRGRNVSAVALRLPQRSELWLFDCGEGTQRLTIQLGLRRSLAQLEHVFITSKSWGNLGGLPGMCLSARSVK